MVQRSGQQVDNKKIIPRAEGEGKSEGNSGWIDGIIRSKDHTNYYAWDRELWQSNLFYCIIKSAH